jgi:hypothetical protein
MENIDFSNNDSDEENMNILVQEDEQNKDNLLFNLDSWEELINLIGLNKNINYPLKVVYTGIYEMHLSRTTNYSSNYSRNLIFKSDPISLKIKKILFGSNNELYISISTHVIMRRLKSIYRNYKYNNIINIIDYNINKEVKNNTLGFNYDNLRWSSLDTLAL